MIGLGFLEFLCGGEKGLFFKELFFFFLISQLPNTAWRR